MDAEYTSDIFSLNIPQSVIPEVMMRSNYVYFGISLYQKHQPSASQPPLHHRHLIHRLIRVRRQSAENKEKGFNTSTFLLIFLLPPLLPSPSSLLLTLLPSTPPL